MKTLRIALKCLAHPFSIISRYRPVLASLAALGLIALLSACSSPGKPLRITSVTVDPEPIVGQIVTLEITVEANEDGDNVEFLTNIQEDGGVKVHLISGDTYWQGSLTANQPQTFHVSVCVTQEGSWPVDFMVRSVGRSGWADRETIDLRSTLESGVLILSKDYTFSQDEYARRPTPRPFEVSAECSGETK